jgi:hypothetical protein
MILWRGRIPGRSQLVLAFAAALFVIWLLSMHVSRYLMPAQPLSACLAALALVSLAGARGARRALAIVVGGGFLLFGTFTVVAYNAQFARVLLGRETKEAYLGRTASNYLMDRAAMESVPPDGRILVISGPTYYLERPHERVELPDLTAGGDHLWRKLQSGHFKYLLLPADSTTSTEQMAPTLRELGQRLRLVWKKTFPAPVSRTWGGYSEQTVALYAVVGTQDDK